MINNFDGDGIKNNTLIMAAKIYNILLYIHMYTARLLSIVIQTRSCRCYFHSGCINNIAI